MSDFVCTPIGEAFMLMLSLWEWRDVKNEAVEC